MAEVIRIHGHGGSEVMRREDVEARASAANGTTAGRGFMLEDEPVFDSMKEREDFQALLTEVRANNASERK